MTDRPRRAVCIQGFENPAPMERSAAKHVKPPGTAAIRKAHTVIDDAFFSEDDYNAAELVNLDDELDYRQQQLQDWYDRDPVGFIWFNDNPPPRYTG